MNTAAVSLLVAFASQSSAGQTLRLDFRPSGDPQIAIWLEDEQGTFVETLMVTRTTGTFGLGNRPGRPDFGGGYLWPYGRREMVLPVWAHRRGATYPRLVFQDCREDSLGWHERHSSEEPYYCRPLSSQESRIDALSCPTTRFSSDKGIPLSEVNRSTPECQALFARYANPMSFYPPRNDLRSRDPSRDWAGLNDFDTWNDLDAVSQATPPSDEGYHASWRLPAGLADGQYYVFVEVNQAYDFNRFHDYDFFIDPMLRNYGVRVLGQPSIVWRVPIVLSREGSVGFSNEYWGYGSPDGQDGMLRPADGTITVGTEGTGAGRLLPIQGEGGAYQIRAEVIGESGQGEGEACQAPVAPRALREIGAEHWQIVELDIEMAPTTPGIRYEVRYAELHDSIQNEEDFRNAVPGTEVDLGSGQTRFNLVLDLPRPNWAYTIAIRAKNDCGDASDIVAANVSTERREFAAIDACFVATAAHGARYAEDVAVLRSFRDQVLLETDLGLTAVEFYYYVSPSIAEAIRDRPALQTATRWALTPVVWVAGQFE